MPQQLVPIAIIFILVGLPIICGTLIKLAKITREREGPGGRSGRRSPKGDGEMDESELMQEIHRGLNRLENRIEALETIVLNSENKKTSSSSHE